MRTNLLVPIFMILLWMSSTAFATDGHVHNVYLQTMGFGQWGTGVAIKGTPPPNTCSGDFHIKYSNIFTGTDEGETVDIARRKMLDLLLYAKMARRPVNLTYEALTCSSQIGDFLTSEPDSQIHAVELIF